MKKLLFLALMFSFVNSYAQQYTLSTELVNQYMPNNAPGLDVIVETSIGDDSFYETKLIYEGEVKIFKLKPFTYPSFEVKLKSAIKEVIGKVEVNGIELIAEMPKNMGLVEKEIRVLFANFVTYYNTEDEKPVVATIYLKSDIPVYYSRTNKGKNNDYTLGVNKLSDVTVEISFYGGFIEKIQVQGKIKDTPIVFNNKYSIGISSTKNIRQLNNYNLFSDVGFSDSKIKSMMDKEEEEVYNTLDKLDTEQQNINKEQKRIDEKDKKDKKENNSSAEQDTLNNRQDALNKEKLELLSEQNKNKNNNKYFFIKVADVIRYVKKVDVNANDVSPVPQLLILDKDQKHSKLYKEESSKLFEAVVYTDFLGLFEENNPNGIIQTEVNKRFNLNTKRSDVYKWFLISEGIGYLQYFDASFQYTKIESDNKFVAPNQFKEFDENGQVTDSTAYYSPISIYQNKNFSIGGNLNLLTLENQNAKLNMYLNLGFLFGRTGLKDSENDTDGFYTNNLEIPIEYQFHILPEKRVSFLLSDRLSWFETFNSDINLKSIEDGNLTPKNNWLNTFNIDLNVDISSSGKLFLRYKLTHDLDNINNNFSRFQFGYSFYLLKNNGVKGKVKN